MTAVLPGLADIEGAARAVYEAMPPTPQYLWPLLREHVGADVWVKHENHAPMGAFKVRGGLAYLDALLREGRPPPGVIAATRGNHGQSIGYAARRHGIQATIVVPRGNSVEKNAAMRALGAHLIEHGDDFQDALDHARELAHRDGLHLVPSFDSRLVRGVATYGVELFRAVPGLDVVYVPIGLGSGACGVIAAREALGLSADIVGVVSAQAPAYAESIATGGLVEREARTRIADGLACRRPVPQALEILGRHLARVVTVTDEEIEAAMRVLFSATHNVAEGAGAAAFAAALQERGRLRGRRIGLILSGCNVDRQSFASVLAG